MTGGFQKFIGGFLCVVLVLALALGAYYGGSIRRAIAQLDEFRPADTGGADEAYLYAEAVLRGQKNLFVNCEETLSAPDAANLTVEFSLRAVPFEIATGSSATAFVRGHRILLRLRDGVLEGSARLPLAALAYNDDGPLEYRILLHEGPKQRNQAVAPEFIWDSPFAGNIAVNHGTPYDGKLELAFHYELDGAYVPFGDTAAKANIYALTYTYGGAGERTQDLMFNAYFEDGVLDQEETFEVGEKDLLRFYAEVVGKSGMVYRYWLEDFVSPEYVDRFDFPWWEENLESREYIYIAGKDDQVEFWF